MSYSPHPFTFKLFQLTALTLALTLAGCGGDSVDVITPAPGGSGGQPGTGGGNNNGNGNNPGMPISAVNITPIALTDTNGNLTRIITSAGVSAKVTVTDNKREPIGNALVTFEGDGVKFGTSNGAVLTNEKGEAVISVKPLDNTNTGSYQLRATTSYNNLTATTDSYNFSLQSIQVVLADVVLSSSSLESGGNTNITLKTKDSTNNIFQNDVTVNFDTSCGTFDNNSMVSSNQGDITTTYKAIDNNGNLCEGNQTITATPANNPANKRTLTVNIASVEANSIIYSTMDKVQLGSSTSGSSISSKIEFIVYANGRPAANQAVEISKTYAPADFSFVKLNNRPTETVISDSQGRVVVNLYPGALPGPVEIKAALRSNPNIFALSKDVSVATGRAVQNGFSVSVTKNVLAIGTDGDTSTFTAALVDRVGNPVPDGTVVSFISEGGRVTPNCSTKAGVCNVEFSTQNPRPVDSRVTIIAYVEGEKQYIDVNADNKYTAGIDILTSNIGDFFRDDNENNRYDQNLGEFVYRRGASGATCAPSSFNQPNIPGTCDNGLAATLRFQFVLGLASDTPVFTGLPATLIANPANNLNMPKMINFKMFGNSEQTVSMPSGTTISIATEGAGECKAEFTNGNLTVPKVVNLGNNTVSTSNVSYGFSYTGCQKNDKIKITVNSPAPDATTTTKTLFVQ